MAALLVGLAILLVMGWVGYSRMVRGSSFHFSIMLSIAGIAAFACFRIGRLKAAEGGFLAGIVGFAMMLALGIGMIGMAIGAGIAVGTGRGRGEAPARSLNLILEATAFYLVVGGAIVLSLMEETGQKYGPGL